MKRFALLITAIYLLCFFTHALLLNKTVYGDGIFYYSWLHSIVVDHDIDFTNQYEHFKVTQPIRPSGIPGNKYSVGPALFWAPAFISVYSVLKGTGYELPYQLAVGFTNVSLALAGLLLLFNILRKSCSEFIAIAVVTCVALATNLLFYGSIDPVNTHALTFFTATFYLTLLFEKGNPASAKASAGKGWFLIGIALGLISILRPQDLVYGLLLFVIASVARQSLLYKDSPLQRRVLCITFIGAGFLLAFLPQILAWKALYGSFFANPYFLEGQTFNFLQPKILEVLFSPNHGLFLWTPLLLLSFFGLVLPSELRSLNSKLFLIIVILQAYIVASWFMWWQGESYSGRMFVSLLPLFAFGLANFFTRFRHQRLLPYIVGGFSLLNFVSIVYFLL